MSQRLTPLTRNQLLELEALMRGLIAVVSQPQHYPATSGTASVANQSRFSSAPSTPTSITTGAEPPTSAFLSSLPQQSGTDASAAVAGLSTSTSLANSADVDGASSLYPYRRHPQESQIGASCDVDHAALHGTFLDVFADPCTSASWRLYDKMLYVVWWSYRPQSCTNCGMQDAWMPSGDVEFKCVSCLTGAGTTRSNAVVEDIAGGNEEGDYGNGNDSGDDDDVEEKEKGTSGGGGGVETGGGPLETYLFFYEWMQRIPVLGPAGSAASSAGHRNASGGGNGREAELAQSSPPRMTHAYQTNTAAASSSSLPGYARAGRGQGSAAHQQQQSTSKASSSVALPSGEALPTVLRAAYDMSCLLTAPGLPRGTARVIRAAGLYMSLLLHRYASLFPLFCVAGRTVVDGERAATKDAQSSSPAMADAQPIEVELQWVDVELVSALLGVAAPSFFESTEVSVQHLQNVFTVAVDYGVPSVLWHPGRVPGRVEAMKTLKEKVIPLCPLHSTTAGVSGLCPEHTAMIVALEMARRVDAHPVAASSTSPAAAVQNAQRIGQWLDALGLYPTRRVYRDVQSYLHVEADEEKRRQKRNAVKAESGDVKAFKAEVKFEEGQEEEAEEQRRTGAMRAWEATLTTLAAVNDAHLINAAERHARRHETSEFGTPANPMYLTTQRSPFYRRFEWILTSPCANALLHVFAAVFRLTPMELADMALRSGIYQGHASGFVATLRTAVTRGAFDAMPLARRLSPLTSSWMATYMALHSGDRLPLLAALVQFNDGQNATRDRQAALTRLLQRILRKHHAAQLYQLNYVLRVTDEDEKHFNGVYFLSNVLWQEGLAVFTCLRSGRKTITLNRFANTLSLCYMKAKEKIVSRLSMHVVSPVVAAVETDAVRLVMEVAIGTVARGASTMGDPWGTVVRCLDKCARVRRRMRVPMLASRLDALASIREQVKSAVRRFQQFPALSGGGSGGGGGTGMGMAPTLLGWGETEALLASAPQLDARQLRRDLQWNFLALPNASLLSGFSENRVVAMYASLVGLLELVYARLGSQGVSDVDGPSAALLSNWVEELLFVEEEDEEEETVAADAFVDAFHGPFSSSAAAERAGPGGWSPPTYRNSRGGTPKLSRSPKSKFIAVSTATSAAAPAAAAPTSAFTATYASGGGRFGATQTAPPPSAFAHQPYTMTPPSLAPSRSPILRAAIPSTTPPLSFTRAPQGNLKGSGHVPSVSTSHNAVSTPIRRFQSPPPSSTTIVSVNGISSTPPLACASAGNSKQRTSGKLSSSNGTGASGADGLPPLLPDLELSASTADVERRLQSASKTSAQRRVHRETGRRRRRERGDSDGEEGSDGEGYDVAKDTEEEEDVTRHSQQQRQRQRSCGKSSLVDPQAQVLRLLWHVLPPYWDVLLGFATDVALPTSASIAGRGNDEDDDEDEAEDGGENKARKRTATATSAGETGRTKAAGAASEEMQRRMATQARERERRLRKSHRQQPHSSTGSCVGGFGTRSGAARASDKESGAALRSEAAVVHRPFNVFDAEECRRRLHRLYVFIAAYIQCKQRCHELAAAGALPTVPEKLSSPPPPSTVGPSKATGSPPTTRSFETANGGDAGGAAALLRSPRAHLTPPPPYPADTVASITDASARAQRSPPRSRPSPPPAPQRTQPASSSLLLSPHSPEPRHGTSTRSPRHGGGTSPVPLSPPLAPARVNEYDGVDARRGSPKQQQQTQATTTTSVRSPLRPSPPQTQQQRKRSSGQGQRGKGGRDKTAVALVDDENFALPPSEVTWKDHRDASTDKAENVEKASRDSATTAAGRREGQRHRYAQHHNRPQSQTGTASSSTTASDAEEVEAKAAGKGERATATLTHHLRKRIREGNDDGGGDGKCGSAEEERRDTDPDSDGEEGREGGEAPQQQLRRKAKKLGRRRRRQEQNVQYQEQQQLLQQAKRGVTSPSRSGSNSKEGSRSPEIRAWRNGRISGSVSPLGNSPALPPRPSAADGAAAKLPAAARTNHPSSPTQNAVPSIRGRDATSSSSSSASDSGRSADYDTDAI